jgi:hypothetical protein
MVLAPEPIQGLSLSAFQATRRHTACSRRIKRGFLGMGSRTLRLKGFLKHGFYYNLWLGHNCGVPIIECFVDRTYRHDFV